MRALVISAFILTLGLSALTVFFALNSNSMDGEPYALITIEPPVTANVTPPPQVSEPEIASTPRAPAIPTEDNSQSTETTVVVPKPQVAIQTDTPKLTPAADDDLPPGADDIDAADAGSGADTPETEQTVSTTDRPTETAQPVATTQPIIEDPLFSSAEPGLGLGVGNLGPLDTVKSTN